MRAQREVVKIFLQGDVVLPMGRRARLTTVESLPWVPNYHAAFFFLKIFPHLKNKDTARSVISYED